MNTKVTILNKSGKKIVGVVHIPDATKHYACVILLHGNTGHKDETHIVSLAHYLETRGIASLRFDTSGIGESDGDIEHDYRVTNYISDVEVIFDFVRTHPDFDAKKIALWGHSMGGMIAFLCAQYHPELTCISAVAPSGALSKSLTSGPILKEWEATGWLTKTSTVSGKSTRLPWAFAVDRMKYDSLVALQKMHIPVQFIMGTADQTVSQDVVREQYEISNEPKEYKEIPAMPHEYSVSREYMDQVNAYVYEFLHKHFYKE